MFDDTQANQTQTDNSDNNDTSNDFGTGAISDFGMNPSDGSGPTVVTPTASLSDDQTDVPSNAGTDSSDDVSSDITTEDTDASAVSDSFSTDDPTASDSSSDDNVSTDTTSDSPPTDTSPTTGDLAELKRQALDKLSPLVHKLDQTPEEKYRTLMMLIQASDNKDLLSEAYEAADKISNEKARAEALLNIVNEINYFTQKG